MTSMVVSSLAAPNLMSSSLFVSLGHARARDAWAKLYQASNTPRGGGGGLHCACGSVIIFMSENFACRHPKASASL